MSSIENISCVNTTNKCNYISPVNSLNIYPNSNGISKITGRPITDSELNSVFTTYSGICNSKGGSISTCCDPSITTISTDDPITLAYYNELKAMFPSGRMITDTEGSTYLQLSKTDMTGMNGWQPFSPYMMCKVNNAGFNLSRDPVNPNAVNVSNLNDDCSSNNCDNSSITFDMLMSNVSSDNTYTYADDAKVADDIKNGYINNVKSYIYKYNYVDQPLTMDTNQNRMIHLAALYNQLDILNMLIAVNANINIQNGNGDTPLHFGVKANNQDIVNSLITQGANIRERNNAGETPIFNSLLTGDMYMITILYNNGASVLDKDNKGNNLCHYAIMNSKNKRDIMTFLTDRGVSVGDVNNAGHTPLNLLNMRIAQQLSSDNKNNIISSETYLALKNEILNNKKIARMNSNSNSNSNYVSVEGFSNIYKMGKSDNNVISESLEDLLTIETQARNKMFLGTNGLNPITINSASATSWSPVLLENKVCVPKYGTNNKNITGNENREQCEQMGGEMAAIPSSKVNITVGYSSSNDGDIESLKQNTLYNPVYSELEPVVMLPTPSLNPTLTPQPIESNGVKINEKFGDVWNTLSSKYENNHNNFKYITILILVLFIVWIFYLIIM